MSVPWLPAVRHYKFQQFEFKKRYADVPAPSFAHMPWMSYINLTMPSSACSGAVSSTFLVSSLPKKISI